MRKPAQLIIASVLAGFTLVCLGASATAQEQNDWPASKRVECFNPAGAA
jgi:hypothetical protein